MIADAILFRVLVFFTPLQLSKHFWPESAFVYGIRVDYLAPKLFITDFIIFLLLISWFARKPIFSKATQKAIYYSFIFVATLVFVNAVFLSTSPSFIFPTLKFIEYLLLILYVSQNHVLVQKSLPLPLLFSLIYLLAIALLQFISDSSIGGLFYFIGERNISATLPGIALVNLFGHSKLRPYATFPHPNALGGYALVSFLLICNYSKNSLVKASAFFASTVLILLSFSQNAWLAALTIALIFIMNKTYATHTFSYLFIMASAVFSLISPLVYKYLLNISSYPQNITRRLYLSVISGKMISESPFFGIGLGAFIRELPLLQSKLELSNYPEIIWWLQPVHNIFLLIASELGLLSLIVFVALLWKLALLNFQHKKHFTYPLLAIIFTGTFDHYWLTLQQTRIMFAIVLGLMLPKLLK